MPGLIYRRSDGLPVFTVDAGQPFRGLAVEVDRNVVPNYGGALADYAWLDAAPDDFQGRVDLRVVDGVLLGDPAPAVDVVAPVTREEFDMLLTMVLEG